MHVPCSTSHEPDKVGVIISQLISLMDEQVFSVYVCAHIVCDCACCKVGKLSSVGVQAARAVSSDSNTYTTVLYFGIWSYYCSHYVHNHV